MNLELLAAEIKARRLLLGITQQDVEELSGVSIRTIKSLESGKAAYSIATLFAVTEALGLEIVLQVPKMSQGNEE